VGTSTVDLRRGADTPSASLSTSNILRALVRLQIFPIDMGLKARTSALRVALYRDRQVVRLRPAATNLSGGTGRHGGLLSGAGRGRETLVLSSLPATWRDTFAGRAIAAPVDREMKHTHSRPRPADGGLRSALR
jgi:hypothetical protein